MNSPMIFALVAAIGMAATTASLVENGPSQFRIFLWGLNLAGLLLNAYWSGRADA